jgi:hypothetical protein
MDYFAEKEAWKIIKKRFFIHSFLFVISFVVLFGISFAPFKSWYDGPVHVRPHQLLENSQLYEENKTIIDVACEDLYELEVEDRDDKIIPNLSPKYFLADFDNHFVLVSASRNDFEFDGRLQGVVKSIPSQLKKKVLAPYFEGNPDLKNHTASFMIDTEENILVDVVVASMAILGSLIFSISALKNMVLWIKLRRGYKAFLKTHA